MTAMFSLNYVPDWMFNLFLGQLREHSHVLINPLRDDVYYDFYRIRPETEEDYWARDTASLSVCRLQSKEPPGGRNYGS